MNRTGSCAIRTVARAWARQLDDPRHAALADWPRPCAPRTGLLTLLVGLLLVLAGLPRTPVLAQPASAAPGPAAGSSAGGAGPRALAIPGARQAKNVAVISIEGAINSTTARSVKRRMNEAAKAGADALVFELNTPGGEVGAVLEIADLIQASPVPNTVAWVNPQAYSGGAIIALACREMVVAGTATLGDALPVQAVMGVALNPKMGEAERQKVLAPLLAELVDSARRTGRDEKLVQGIVTLGVELWLVESLDRPGEQLFIDRNEFRLIFGQEPPSASPTLVSAGSAPPPPAAPPGTPITPGSAADPAAPQPPAAAITDGPGARPQPAPEAFGLPGVFGGGFRGSGGGTPSEGQFIPASPVQSDKLVRDVNDRLIGSASTRTILTGSDRGRWRLVEYVADGRGVYTLKTPELLRYRLAVPGPGVGGTVDSDAELKAFFGAANLSRLDQSWSESMVAFLTHPIVRALLLVVFLLSAFLEMTHPGLIIPGTVAAVALILLLSPPLLVGMAAWWEVAAILAGLVLLGLEIFVAPGVGVLGILGAVLLFGGLVGTFIPQSGSGLFPDTAEGRNDVLYAVATVVLSTATSLVGMYFIGKHFGSLPVLGKLVLNARPATAEDRDELLAAIDPGASGPAGVRVGAVGVALTPLRPAGRVQIGDALVDVVCEMGFISAGAPVRVTGVSAFRVSVEAAASMPSPVSTPGGPAGPASRGGGVA